MTRWTSFMLVSVVLVGAVCGGCQEKFTRQRYETIYVGQPAFEVEATLGEPYAKFSDSWSYIKEKPFQKAVVSFEDGRVIDKAWYDKDEMGDHPDSKFRNEDKTIVIPKIETVVE